MKKIIKKVITILMIFIITFNLSDISVRADYTPEEQAVVSQANKLLKACKKYDLKRIRSCVVHKNNIYHFIEPSIIKNIKKTQKKYFSYSVDAVRINGRYAYVDVSVTNFDSYSLAKSYLKESINIKLRNKSWNQKKNMLPLLLKYYRVYLKHFNPDDDLFDDTYTLKFKQKGTKWLLAKNNYKLYDLMDGGISNAFMDFEKDPIKFYFN